MLFKLRMFWWDLRSSVTQLLDWLLMTSSAEDLKKVGDELSKLDLVLTKNEREFASERASKRAEMGADKHAEKQLFISPSISHTTVPADLPARKVVPGMRHVTYYAKSGHCFKFDYTGEMFQQMMIEIAGYADDPNIEFDDDDVFMAHEKLRFTELTMDCQDAARW